MDTGVQITEGPPYVYLYYDCLNGPIRLTYSRLISSTFKMQVDKFLLIDLALRLLLIDLHFFIATIQIGIIVQVCYTPLARCVTYTYSMMTIFCLKSVCLGLGALAESSPQTSDCMYKMSFFWTLAVVCNCTLADLSMESLRCKASSSPSMSCMEVLVVVASHWRGTIHTPMTLTRLQHVVQGMGPVRIF